MSDPSAIYASNRRLEMALDALQAAVARKREAETGGDGVAMQLQALGIDRARLASELDNTSAQVRRLEGINREVARRIDVAMGTIQKLLDEHDR